MPATKISLDEAKPNKLFYVVATAIIVRRLDKRCLILQRDPREKVHAGLYGVIGGKLEWQDLDVNHPTRINGDALDYERAIEDLVIREAKEESGITIKPPLRYIDSMAFIRPDNIPVVLLKFAVEYKSGSVVLEQGGFTNYAWVNAEEVKRYPCIDGIKREVVAARRLFETQARVV